MTELHRIELSEGACHRRQSVSFRAKDCFKAPFTDKAVSAFLYWAERSSQLTASTICLGSNAGFETTRLPYYRRLFAALLFLEQFAYFAKVLVEIATDFPYRPVDS